LSNSDLTDARAPDDLFSGFRFDAVIHFAGLKAVGESVQKPLEYYQNNLVSTLNLLFSMKKPRREPTRVFFERDRLRRSKSVPIRGGLPPLRHESVWAHKLMIEDILRDVSVAAPELRICLLRYFNPVGAHISGKIGEDPSGIPNNLMPYIAQVAVGKLT
jgi:UDP-glucose 4-epimerase